MNIIMQIFFIIFNTFSSKSMIFLLYSPMMLCSMFLLSTLTNTNMALTLDSTHLFSFITNYEHIMFEFKNQWSIADNIYPTDSCLNTIGIQLAWLPFFPYFMTWIGLQNFFGFDFFSHFLQSILWIIKITFMTT